MRIEVIDGGWTTPQARAYAEYRLFTTLARHARAIRTVRVILERRQRKGGAEGAICAVDVVLEPSGTVRARANGRQPHGAIDKAADRIGELLNRLPFRTYLGPSH
jgi:ribosome-associated translation inhibitor RaiA